MVKQVMYGIFETAWQSSFSDPPPGTSGWCRLRCSVPLPSPQPVFRFEPCYSIWLTARWRDEYYFSTASLDVSHD